MKKAMQWSLGMLICAVVFALVLPANAKSSKPAAKKKTEHVSVYWAIESTDPSAHTIEIGKSDSSTNLTLKVTGATKIMVDGKPGKLADLQKGQKVTFNATGDICSSIEASAAPEKKAPAKKK